MYAHNCVFRCNPKLNKECDKTGCQKDCFFTTHIEYSADGKYYVYSEFIDNYEETKIEMIPDKSDQEDGRLKDE